MENTLLNLIPAAYLPEVHISQYDIGRTLTFNLKEGASDYNVPTGATVTVKATKPSGFGFAVPCTFSGGVVTLVVTETMTPEHGRFPAELSIVSGNTTIGTSNFIFNIERSPHPEGTIDGDAETIIPELTLLVERIEAAAEDVDEKAELFLNLSAEAETLPAGSLATANYSDGVLTLGIPRGYDGDDTKADAIVKSASGDVASFSDGGNGLLVKSLKVNIVPKQSGSGDPSPSNVRPISGWDAVETSVFGENVFDNSTFVKGRLDSGVIGYTDGTTSFEITESGVKFTTNDVYRGVVGGKIRVMPNAEYCLTAVKDTSNYADMYLDAYTKDDTWIRRLSGTQGSGSTTARPIILYTIPSNCEYVRISFQKETAGTTEISNISLNYPSTDHDYHKFVGNSTITTNLGQTVYGGTLEVMSGKLTITKVLRNLGTDQSGVWYMASTSVSGKQRLAVGVNDIKTPNANVICNIFKTVSGNDVYNGVEGIGTDANERVLFYKSDLQTVADWKSWATTNNLTVCYELETPLEIQLTPTEVKTLLGSNNIWSDSGTVEVEYRADTTLAYNELLSLIASLS